MNQNRMIQYKNKIKICSIIFMEAKLKIFKENPNKKYQIIG